ncbi:MULTISPECIES: AAA family ATPase [unclassified Paenibacillus]|uniref:AAA family ATPase n=1 Tax=unclassified Paenibacillus TaxID=185978 RepID=UPI003633083A
MSKMKLVLLEQDSYFIDMISSYIRTSDYAETFTMSVFTTKEQGFSYIGRTQELYILLVNESFMPLPELVFRQQHGCLILLSNTRVQADIVEYPVLCKYQPLNQLLSHIVSHFNEFTTSRMLKGNRSSEVIAVYSAVGGSGKTLAAVHLARELTYKGMRVFYLNFEQLPSPSWLKGAGSESENCFSRMLYYGKTDPRVQSAKVERYKRKHHAMGFDFFPGVSDSAEMSEMTELDTESIIKAVLATGRYDCILLDLDSSLYPRTLASLKLSDSVLWLVIDDRIHLEKTMLQIRQFADKEVLSAKEVSQKLRLVFNKYSGSMKNEVAALEFPVLGYLPYIPEWKAIGTMDVLQARGVFSENLAALSWLAARQQGGQSNVVG